MSVKNRKVLIVTAKWPLLSDSTDGGDVTLAEVISALRKTFKIHLMAFRDDVPNDVVVPGVERVAVVRGDFANFGTYARHDSEKFSVRIRQSVEAADSIARVASSYDCVVVIHAMFLLGLSERPDILSRCVLFPMFTGIDYGRSGEHVPAEYIRLERIALPLVSGIITPSERESDTLVHDYGVPRRVISIIPRIVEGSYLFRERCKPGVVNIAYVASVRLQKDHLSAVRLVKTLADRGVNVCLRCIGAIQDEDLHAECCEYARANGIETRVLFEGNRSRRDVFEIVSDCSFNISTSQCETFGRGIREGMAMGVPTIVRQTLAPLFSCEDERDRPVVSADVIEMAETIVRLIGSPADYARESAKGDRLAQGGGSDNIAELIRQQVLRVCNSTFGEIVLVPESALVGCFQNEETAQTRRMFVRRQFDKLNLFLESEQKRDVAAKTNWALSCHLVGRHDEAHRLYESLSDNAAARVNRLAFCHRDFCCEDVMQFAVTGKDSGGLSALLAHNLMNCKIACGLKAFCDAAMAPVPVLAEHVSNDVSVRLGRKVSSNWDKRLQQDFVDRSVVVTQRRFAHPRRRVGFFLTDLQRHQDPALLYEIVDLLAPRCDIYVYFSNAFDNKLIRQFVGVSTVRNVSGCSLEGVGNLIFDDEIEVLVDMAGHGLRNSCIALARVEERLNFYEMLAGAPILLRSPRYYGDRSATSKHGAIVILGDARCISDWELEYVGNLVKSGRRVVYPSYSFNEPMFAEFFRHRLRRAGITDGAVEICPCIRPFSRYLDFLSGALSVIVANGATSVELSEALFCGVSVVITSGNSILVKMAEEYAVPVVEKSSEGMPAGQDQFRVMTHMAVSARFVHIVENVPSMLLTKVEDHNTRVAYRFGKELFCFHETCNGDAIVLANGDFQ